jgi:hypothetical protein
MGDPAYLISNAGSGVGYPSGMLHAKVIGIKCGGRRAGSGVGSKSANHV